MTTTTEPDCSTDTTENEVCQPVGGMTPDDLAPIDGTEPVYVTLPGPILAGPPAPPPALMTSTAAGTPGPALGTLPTTGAALIGAELALATTLVAAGAALRRWAR